MKVLLIEHSRGLLFSLHRFLEASDFKVEESFDGVIALNNFDKSFDLVIIDSDTPRVPYLDILKLIKEKKGDVKVIVLYNNYIIDEDTLVNNLYVNDYLPRPFSPDDLLTSLKYLDKCKNPKYSVREELILDKLKSNEVVSYQDIYEITFNNDDTLRSYINAINRKLIDEEIEVKEKGFKLVKRNGK